MIRVLVVENHEIVRDALAALLSETVGMEVVGVASTVGCAIPLLDRHDPDIVLADLSLGDGSATELVKAVRRARLKGRVVILTGFRDAFAAAEALAGGAVGYVLRSQSSAEVLEAIRVVALGRSYVAPQIASKLSTASAGDAPIRVKQGGGLESLSPREHEIFRQAVQGYASKEIARRLCISQKTVESHRTHINRKLAVRTAADLVRFAVAHGIAVAPSAVAEQHAVGGAASPDALH
jgi:DNA-binding NarL/FixJ family response regulator